MTGIEQDAPSGGAAEAADHRIVEDVFRRRGHGGQGIELGLNRVDGGGRGVVPAHAVPDPDECGPVVPGDELLELPQHEARRGGPDLLDADVRIEPPGEIQHAATLLARPDLARPGAAMPYTTKRPAPQHAPGACTTTGDSYPGLSTAGPLLRRQERMVRMPGPCRTGPARSPECPPGRMIGDPVETHQFPDTEDSR